MANGFAPSTSYLRRFAVNRPGQPEVIRQTLYDAELYPLAGQQQVLLFQRQIGAGFTTAIGAAVGSPKTLADTNMTLAGQLPALLNFVLQSIELRFEPGRSAVAQTFLPAVWSDATDPASLVAANAGLAAWNDFQQFVLSGWLVLRIGNKDYLTEAPLNRFPPKTRYDLFSAFAADGPVTTPAVYRAQVADMGGRPYFIDPPISLMSNQNFSVTLFFPSAIPTISGFNARVNCVLDGFTFRASQ
ncbi:MAG: hypothetical protein ACREPG_00155 [Candidatus Binatia bacterium]